MKATYCLDLKKQYIVGISDYRTDNRKTLDVFLALYWLIGMTLDQEHSAILALLVVAVDGAQIPD